MSRSTPNQRMLLGLLGILALGLVGFNAKTLVQPSPNSLFAPNIAVVMGEGTTYDFFNNAPGCEGISYSIQVQNTSTNNEALSGIVVIPVSDSELSITGPVNGDNNNDGILQSTEIWEYKGDRIFNPAHVQNQEISNQVRVTASVIGQTGITVTDDSHPSDLKDDKETTSVILCVPGVALTQTTTALLNPLGESGGCHAIEYEYKVYNTTNTSSFHNIVLYDATDQSPIPGIPDGDEGISGDLEPGEVWIYKQVVVITAGELHAGLASRQSYVAGETTSPGTTYTVSDVSDYYDTIVDPNTFPESELARPTITDLTACQPKIAMLKTAVTQDGGGMDGGCAFIQYTATIFNFSGDGQNLTNIDVIDESLLPITFEGPFGDNGDDILETSET